jgi:hypothetical protein
VSCCATVRGAGHRGQHTSNRKFAPRLTAAARLATVSLATAGRLQQSRCPDSFLLSRKEQLAALAPRSRHFAIRKGEKITCTIDWDGQEARLITDRAMRRLVRSEIPLPPLFIERIINGSPRTGIS